MTPSILGLHHVTATVDEAQPDLDFCTGALGLRLVKKTVNFDNHFVYHFYYGVGVGRPGTIWTTFPYYGRGVPQGVRGAGQVTVTSLSVPAGTLAFWRESLAELGFPVREERPRFGEESIVTTDPSGLAIELVATPRDSRDPWTGGGADPSTAVRGLHSVTLTVRDPGPTVAFLRERLGFEIVAESEGRTRMAARANLPGHVLDVVHDPDAPPAGNGIGTVHHVAVAIGSGGEQVALRDELVRHGVNVTPVRDRQYFTSIYFREPGGVLLEVATIQPGFTVDEAADDLGRGLKLPPWEESHRAEIEAELPDVTTP